MTLELEIHNADVEDTGKDIKDIEAPGFTEYEPDIQKIKSVAGQYNPDNLVVIGNGGSITSFRGLYYAFIGDVEPNVRLVTTQDPDYLHRISRSTSPENTLVVPVSKSGETTSVLESLMYFIKRDYPVFAITSDNNGALRNIVEEKGYDWMEHPPVGGRFTGATETALMPAALAGIDIEEIRRGAEEVYSTYDEENAAWHLAEVLYTAEQEGFDQILSPFYSTRLFGFYPLFVQLMHETVCKRGKGQTVCGDLGPEFQHHTNQRLFGGKNNIFPLFFRTDAHEHEVIEVPEELEDTGLRDKKLGDLSGLTHAETLKAEYEGVKQDLLARDRPFATLTSVDMSYSGIGKMMALLQLLAVYSAELRGVNPYNQPDVEKSKELGFQQRFKE